jgi:saccharopine dehydrogenase-like NADP-dependent oxidoreductase
MPDFTALIIGCGAVGSASARLCLEGANFKNIVVADRNVERAFQLAESLGESATPLELDCLQEDQVIRSMSGISVVLNTAGPFSRDTVSFMRTVIETGIPYADINDDIETLQTVFESEYLDCLARDRGVGVLPGLGASPGQTNILYKHMAGRMDSAEEARFYTVDDVTHRSESDWGHWLSLHRQPILLYDCGRWTQMQSMSEFQDMGFPLPWGTIRCYTSGLETVTIPTSFISLKHASSWKGFSDPTIGQTLKGLVDIGFGSQEPIVVDDVVVSPVGMAAAMLARMQPRIVGSNVDRLPSQVRVKGIKDGRPTELIMTYSFPPGDMAVASASCLVVGADLLVNRELPSPGVFPPEAMDPAPFLWDMKSRGAHFMLEDSASTRI